MKKILLVLALFVAGARADAIGNVGLGYAVGDNSGNMVTAFGSFNVFAGAALRLEYTKNIDEHAAFSKEDVSRYGVFATYELALLPGLSATPKVGFVQTDGEFEVLDVAGKVTDSDTKFTYGLEIDYYFNNQFSAFLGYTDYGDKLHGIDDVSLKEMDSANYAIGLKLHL
jgi:hypothetical protein